MALVSNEAGGIDSTEGFVHIMDSAEDILVVEIDIDAVRNFPGYFSTRESTRVAAA